MINKIFFITSLVLLLAFDSFGDALDNWTQVAQTDPSFGAYTQIIYANGYYVAVSRRLYSCSDPGIVVGGISVSRDGTNWAHQASPGAPRGLAYGMGIFAFSDSCSSDDTGAVFNSVASGAGTNLVFTIVNPFELVTVGHGIAYGNGIFAAIGYDYEAQQGRFAMSTNGTEWHYHNLWRSNFVAGIPGFIPDQTNITYYGSNFFTTGVAIGNGKLSWLQGIMVPTSHATICSIQPMEIFGVPGQPHFLSSTTA